MLNEDDQRPKAPSQQIIVVAHMMTPGVVQIPGDVTVTEAASLLEREQMPCLLVKDTESRFGLMTPSDIVRKVVAPGLQPDDIEVRSIMTRPVQFIEHDRAVEDASTLMMSTGTQILIVTKQNQPVGVITARDLALSPKWCPTNVSATIRIIEGDAPETQYPATVVQLSHITAAVEASVLLLPGTKVVLNFSLPDLTSPLTIRGTVSNEFQQTDRTATPRAATTPAIDIHFTDLPPADQSRIKAWVLQNSPKSSDLP